MLRHSSDHHLGYCALFHVTPFAPPSDVTTPEEYLVYLRALYRRNPRLFVDWARDARDRGCTLHGSVAAEWARTLTRLHG